MSTSRVNLFLSYLHSSPSRVATHQFWMHKKKSKVNFLARLLRCLLRVPCVKMSRRQVERLLYFHGRENKKKLVWVAVRKFDIVSYNFATLFWFFLKIHFAKEFCKFEAFENDFAVKYFMTSQLPLHIDFEDKKVGSRNVTQFSHYNILHCLAYTMPSLRTFTVISFHTCISIDCVWG